MKKLLSLIALGALLFTWVPFAQAESTKVEICHLTGNQEEPYNKIEVDDNAVPGHLGHGDVMPVNGECPEELPEEPGDKVEVCHLTGREEDPYQLLEVDENAVQAHLNHGDVLADEGECPEALPEEKVKICHRTSSSDPYNLIEIDENAVDAHIAHGDVYPTNNTCPENGQGGGTEDGGDTIVRGGDVIVNVPATTAPLEGFGAGPGVLPETGVNPAAIAFLYSSMIMLVAGALKIAKNEA